MENLLIFTYLKSLKLWDNNGILSREIALYKGLMKKSINYKFLTFGSTNDLKYSNLLENIKIIPVQELINPKIPIIHFIKSFLLPIKLRKIFRELHLIKTNQIYGSWIAWFAKLLFRKKIVIRGGFDWLYRHIVLSDKRGFKNFIKYWMKYFWIYLIEFFAFRFADGVILTSQSDISFVINRFGLKNKFKRSKIRHFPNFIDINLFKPLKVPKKDKSIIFIGKLTKQKNLLNLLKAIEKLKDFSLDIIGKGPMKKKLDEYIKEKDLNVRFLGEYPNEKIPEILNQYKIFILPSFWEGNPKVLLEAMSCGVGCIGANIPSITTIIKHKKNGYLCNHNPDSIKKAIIYLYNNEDLLKKLSLKARDYIINNCSLNSIVNREYQFYKEILKNDES